MTHYELCRITAERFLKNGKLVLFDYCCDCSHELPDVLCFSGFSSTLFEIKISKQDFNSDIKKECRRKYRIKYDPIPIRNKKTQRIHDINWRAFGLQEFIREAPHLGEYRYYVCPWGLIKPEEVKNDWGLFWVTKGRFYLKKKSGKFRRDIHTELAMVINAFRKYDSQHGNNILIKKYLV